MLSRYQSILIGRFIDLITYSCETSNPWFVKTHTAQRVAATRGRQHERAKERGERERESAGRDRSLADRSASNAADLNDLGISWRRPSRRASKRPPRLEVEDTSQKQHDLLAAIVACSPLYLSSPYYHQTPVWARVATVAERHTPTEMEMETQTETERQSTVCCSYIFISNRFTAVRFGSVLGIMYARHMRGKAQSPSRRAQCHLWNHFGGTFHISCVVFNIFIGHHRCH